MAARYHVELDDEMRDVLGRSVITENRLQLPEQLDRRLYERVDKVIKAAGGKWNRSAKAHLFGRDPREALGLAIETGSILDQKKALNQFFTPPDLAEYVVTAANIPPGATELRVLEPSAGDGALARVVRARGAFVLCVELDPALVETLHAQQFVAYSGDFLAKQPEMFLLGAGSFDRVVMNPPFEDDLNHILHAYKFLKPGGYLAAIAAAGVAFRQDKEHRDFRAWVKRLHGHIEPLPDDSFVVSGTSVRTVLVTVRKPHES